MQIKLSKKLKKLLIGFGLTSVLVFLILFLGNVQNPQLDGVRNGAESLEYLFYDMFFKVKTGKTHNLDTIDIFNADGTISEASPLYVGMDRFDCRTQIANDLKEAGLMERVEDYVNKVGYSERNPDTAIEPRLSLQWFLNMQHFADIDI